MVDQLKAINNELNNFKDQDESFNIQEGKGKLHLIQTIEENDDQKTKLKAEVSYVIAENHIFQLPL